MHPRSPSVQLLDITKTGEKPSWNLGVDTILPERAEDVVKFVLLYQNPALSKAHAASACQLLERFRREQERDSNHGRYFEAGSCGGANENEIKFIALPFIAYGTAPPAINELRRALHPVRSLFQHHYRRESPRAIETRDNEQICCKVQPGTEKRLLVEEVWILRLDAGTVITVSSSSGEDLWLKLKLFNPVDVAVPRRSLELDGMSLLLVTRTNSNSVVQLSKHVNTRITDLIRLQWHIKGMVPGYLKYLFEKYEEHVIRLATWVQSYAVLRVAFKPRWIIIMGKSLALLATDRKWVDILAADLESFTEFMTLHIARWQEFGSAEPYISSEELQAQLISLYSKILNYSAHFVRRAGPPLVKNASWKQKVDSLFEDIKQLAVVLEWTAETAQMRAQVLADAGLPEETCRPKGVEELILLVANSLIPEDSMRTSTAYISEVYAQYLATMQFESQQAPSKVLVKSINQVAEELDVMTGLVKSQQKVLSRLKDESKDPDTLNATLQKLEFFHSDLEEYKRSCARLTAQNVDMQMEHHGKAILVFTMVTIIFLPMSFVASVFGMNVEDIRNMSGGQWYFWCCALAMTVFTVGFSVAIAFLGDEMEKKVRALLGSRENKS
ncbi:Similar to hypothetical protein ACLA_018460 [Aspergillus clavatus NRRL 1]; acc. no. XP_001268568 [Pyronema omphalodes CBS 100304]|uniref:Uncharacterized protein n=1 Tax=Pyronema omphalodes (strain CBS 100304) TaxID=1076935 RepID=U4LL29_PYROM|nr:Similar to hypothetical protein ACLA_018460 [Aspergillus clavatus NRRL 1]; acc. no. XP_001268568 [Pyronema omphalodes CBS 100304]